jgi:hypothetical protein
MPVQGHSASLRVPSVNDPKGSPLTGARVEIQKLPRQQWRKRRHCCLFLIRRKKGVVLIYKTSQTERERYTNKQKSLRRLRHSAICHRCVSALLFLKSFRHPSIPQKTWKINFKPLFTRFETHLMTVG